jgi:hypothetical protein
MSYLEPIGNIGGITAPPSPQAPMERGPGAPPPPSPTIQRSDYAVAPAPYPGQPTFRSVNADLKGLNADPPMPILGLNAGASADGAGMEAPQLPEMDTTATDPRPGGPWPANTRPMGGIEAAPGPYYMGGAGATPAAGRGPFKGVRPIAGLGTNRAPVALPVGRPEALERPIRRDPGVRAYIPVDSNGQFKPMGAPANQNPQQIGYSDRGIPAFGNVAGVNSLQNMRSWYV